MSFRHRFSAGKPLAAIAAFRAWIIDMKLLQRWTSSSTRKPLDPSVVIVTKRFCVRLLVLMFFAALPIPNGPGFTKMFVLLTGTNALICAVMAVVHRERPNTRALTHWDEGLAMLALFMVGQVVA